MTLATVRNGLVSQLSSISGLRVYEYPPEEEPELPAAIVTQSEPFVSYGQGLGSTDVELQFQVLLLLHSSDGDQAWSDLEPYLEPAGAASIKSAVDGNLGGNADWARAQRASEAGKLSYQRGRYWGASFQVKVFLSG